MPVTGKVPIQVISYLDPIFEIEIIERSRDEISRLIKASYSRLEEYYKKEIANAKTQEEHSWIGDMYADEDFTISELEKTFVSSLVITLNSVFERHIGLIVREISKDNSKIIYNPRYSYSIKQLKKMLKQVNHPNLAVLGKSFLERLSIYVDIRNVLVHHDGSVAKYPHLRPYIKSNPNFFDLNIHLWKITVKPAYLEQVLEDIKLFFKKVIYEDSGRLVFSWADPWGKD